MTDWLRPMEPTGRPRSPRSTRAARKDPASFERAVERFAERYVSRRTGRPFSATSKRNVLDNLLGAPLTKYRSDHGIVSVAEWNGDHAAEYLRWLQQDLRRDSATIKKVRSQLRSFGRFCDDEFHTAGAAGGRLATLQVSPVTDFERPMSLPLSRGEAGALLTAAPSGRDRVIIATLLYTGMRPSELLVLDVSCLHLEDTPPVVTVQRSIHDATASGPEYRVVPLTVGQSVLPDLLRAHLADPHRPANARRLFLSHRSDARGRHRPLTLEGLRAMLTDLGNATGIKCNASRFRHTFCAWCADAGMQMLHLQQLLGLASSDMVARYYRGSGTQAAVDAAARVRF